MRRKTVLRLCTSCVNRRNDLPQEAFEVTTVNFFKRHFDRMQNTTQLDGFIYGHVVREIIRLADQKRSKVDDPVVQPHQVRYQVRYLCTDFCISACARRKHQTNINISFAVVVSETRSFSVHCERCPMSKSIVCSRTWMNRPTHHNLLPRP